jgi:surfeit locus 1 family protein
VFFGQCRTELFQGLMLNRFRAARLVGLTIAALTGLLILLALGSWQMQRLGWKERVLAERATAAAGQPVPLPPSDTVLTGEATEALAFRRTEAQGVFLHEAERRVQGQYLTSTGRQPDQLGVHVVTPLRLVDGSLLLINRGWAPLTGEIMRPMGRVTVTGLIRPFPEKGWMQPENDPARDAWFRVEARSMTTGLTGPVAGYYLDAVAEPGHTAPPYGGQSRIALPNNHLQYALTWYSLAVVLLGVWGAVVRSRLTPAADGQTQTETKEHA